MSADGGTNNSGDIQNNGNVQDNESEAGRAGDGPGRGSAEQGR